MQNKVKKYLFNLILPAIVLGALTGTLTALLVTVYKFCAKYIIYYSEVGYAYIREHLYFIPVVIVGLVLIAFAFYFIFKKKWGSRGGGIPTAIAVLRGLITFKWLRTIISVFFMSLTSFLIGVPLGNEGPSVLMGTSIGKGMVAPMPKKYRAWSRYLMTGGACAGFSVATGAPISGVLFAVEDAHQRISPMIIIVASVAVIFSRVTAELISPLLNVSVNLFPALNLITLSLKDIWIPLVIGVLFGLFSVAFLHLYKFINKTFSKTLKKVPLFYKILGVFLVTFCVGVCSFNYVSTGHELILSLFDNVIGILPLIVILIIRTILTLSANTNKITGGIFLPILAIGGLFAAILGECMEGIFGLGSQYYSIILVLGITACISGMMKMPLTAIIFSIEALSCHGNILYVIIVVATSYIMTQIFGVKSVDDTVVEAVVQERNGDKQTKVIDAFVTVQKGSFAVGKQIRDIFWPANLFVLSVKPSENGQTSVDQHGGSKLQEGDTLHVRYSTLDEKDTAEELNAIVGEQDYSDRQTEMQ